jgi:cathepsin D
MGMAFQSVSKYGADSVFQTLVSQGAVPEPVFAFKLASSGSELRVGGVNSALYKDSFTYTPVTQQVSYQLHILRYFDSAHEFIRGTGKLPAMPLGSMEQR